MVTPKGTGTASAKALEKIYDAAEKEADKLKPLIDQCLIKANGICEVDADAKELYISPHAVDALERHYSASGWKVERLGSLIRFWKKKKRGIRISAKPKK